MVILITAIIIIVGVVVVVVVISAMVIGTRRILKIDSLKINVVPLPFFVSYKKVSIHEVCQFK